VWIILPFLRRDLELEGCDEKYPKTGGENTFCQVTDQLYLVQPEPVLY
jgi:hypothetical protein